jgi:hypothetical protein
MAILHLKLWFITASPKVSNGGVEPRMNRFVIPSFLALGVWIWISTSGWVVDVEKHKEKIHLLEHELFEARHDLHRLEAQEESVFCATSLRGLLYNYAEQGHPEDCANDVPWLSATSEHLGISYLALKTALDSDNPAFLTLGQRKVLVAWTLGHSCLGGVSGVVSPEK